MRRYSMVSLLREAEAGRRRRRAPAACFTPLVVVAVDLLVLAGLDRVLRGCFRGHDRRAFALEELLLREVVPVGDGAVRAEREAGEGQGDQSAFHCDSPFSGWSDVRRDRSVGSTTALSMGRILNVACE